MNIYDQSALGNMFGGLGGLGGMDVPSSQGMRNMSQHEFEQWQLRQAMGARNMTQEELILQHANAYRRSSTGASDVLEGEFEVVRDEPAQLEQRKA